MADILDIYNQIAEAAQKAIDRTAELVAKSKALSTLKIGGSTLFHGALGPGMMLYDPFEQAIKGEKAFHEAMAEAIRDAKQLEIGGKVLGHGIEEGARTFGASSVRIQSAAQKTSEVIRAFTSTTVMMDDAIGNLAGKTGLMAVGFTRMAQAVKLVTGPIGTFVMALQFTYSEMNKWADASERVEKQLVSTLSTFQRYQKEANLGSLRGAASQYVATGGTRQEFLEHMGGVATYGNIPQAVAAQTINVAKAVSEATAVQMQPLIKQLAETASVLIAKGGDAETAIRRARIMMAGPHAANAIVGLGDRYQNMQETYGSYFANMRRGAPTYYADWSRNAGSNQWEESVSKTKGVVNRAIGAGLEFAANPFNWIPAGQQTYHVLSTMFGGGPVVNRSKGQRYNPAEVARGFGFGPYMSIDWGATVANVERQSIENSLNRGRDMYRQGRELVGTTKIPTLDPAKKWALEQEWGGEGNRPISRVNPRGRGFETVTIESLEAERANALAKQRKGTITQVTGAQNQLLGVSQLTTSFQRIGGEEIGKLSQQVGKDKDLLEAYKMIKEANETIPGFAKEIQSAAEEAEAANKEADPKKMQQATEKLEKLPAKYGKTQAEINRYISAWSKWGSEIDKGTDPEKLEKQIEENEKSLDRKMKGADLQSKFQAAALPYLNKGEGVPEQLTIQGRSDLGALQKEAMAIEAEMAQAAKRYRELSSLKAPDTKQRQELIELERQKAGFQANEAGLMPEDYEKYMKMKSEASEYKDIPAQEKALAKAEEFRTTQMLKNPSIQRSKQLQIEILQRALSSQNRPRSFAAAEGWNAAMIPELHQRGVLSTEQMKEAQKATSSEQANFLLELAQQLHNTKMLPLQGALTRGVDVGVSGIRAASLAGKGVELGDIPNIIAHGTDLQREAAKSVLSIREDMYKKEIDFTVQYTKARQQLIETHYNNLNQLEQTKLQSMDRKYAPHLQYGQEIAGTYRTEAAAQMGRYAGEDYWRQQGRERMDMMVGFGGGQVPRGIQMMRQIGDFTRAQARQKEADTLSIQSHKNTLSDLAGKGLSQSDLEGTEGGRALQLQMLQESQAAYSRQGTDVSGQIRGLTQAQRTFAGKKLAGELLMRGNKGKSIQEQIRVMENQVGQLGEGDQRDRAKAELGETYQRAAQHYAETGDVGKAQEYMKKQEEALVGVSEAIRKDFGDVQKQSLTELREHTKYLQQIAEAFTVKEKTTADGKAAATGTTTTGEDFNTRAELLINDPVAYFKKYGKKEGQAATNMTNRELTLEERRVAQKGNVQALSSKPIEQRGLAKSGFREANIDSPYYQGDLNIVQYDKSDINDTSGQRWMKGHGPLGNTSYDNLPVNVAGKTFTNAGSEYGWYRGSGLKDYNTLETNTYRDTSDRLEESEIAGYDEAGAYYKKARTPGQEWKKIQFDKDYKERNNERIRSNAEEVKSKKAAEALRQQMTADEKSSPGNRLMGVSVPVPIDPETGLPLTGPFDPKTGKLRVETGISSDEHAPGVKTKNAMDKPAKTFGEAADKILKAANTPIKIKVDVTKNQSQTSGGAPGSYST